MVQRRGYQSYIPRFESSEFRRWGSDFKKYVNRPFPNYPWPLLQSESWCSSFHMKISFDSHANEN